MEKVETLSFLLAAQHLLRQLIVLLEEHRDIPLPQRILLRLLRHHRFHGDLLKAQVRQMQYILRKIEIVPRKSPPHIVVHLVPARRRLLKFRHYLIVTALSAPERTHQVVDLLSSVDGENDVSHLPVTEFQHLVIEQNAVGGQRKPELFVVWFLQASTVSHQILHHLPVKQRFPAEEIHLQIDPVPRMRHQKIKRLPARLITHERPSAVVLSFLRKTVSAGQVTVVGDMQTKRLHHRLPAFIFTDILLINILCIQHARFF